MSNKRTIFKWLLPILLLIALMCSMVACSKNDAEEDPDIDTPQPTQSMTFNQYMAKINVGIKTAEKSLSADTNYHLASEYTLYTREENLTLYYEAVYKENRRNGLYYIKIFDNMNHIERLNMYYNASDLYVTVNDAHYRIDNFGTMLIFDFFTAFTDMLDLGEFVYGSSMQELFKEDSIVLSSLIDAKDNMSYIKVGPTRERITIHDVDFSVSPILGPLNDKIADLSKEIGTMGDTITNHYLGFLLSKLLKTSFASIMVNELGFNIESSGIDTTELDLGGRMQDNTKYFVKGSYATDKATFKIADSERLLNSYVYTPLMISRGSFEGMTKMPTLTEADFDFALDYKLDPENNENNNIAMRIYHQLNTADHINANNKYDSISEIISAYYNNEKLYLNTEGAYNSIGNTIALNVLRLPKVYFEGLNASAVMSIIYTDMLQLMRALTSTGGTDGQYDPTLMESLRNAIKNDVEKEEISITVTEELIRQLRGRDTDLMEDLAYAIGVDSETLAMYLGEDFLESLSVVLRYSFLTGVVGVDVYNLTTMIMTTDMTAAEHVGVKFPADLNELNYTKFREPEVVTIEYDITLDPYSSPNVDLGEILGAFVGDATGKNTPYILTIGKVLTIRGKMSEYYIVDGTTGEKKPVVTLNMSFYVGKKGYDLTGGYLAEDEKLLMSVATSPSDVEKLLVDMYTTVGNKDATASGLKYVIDKERVSKQLKKVTGEDGIFGDNTGVSAFLKVYNAADKSSKTYTENDEFFVVSLTASAEKDPVEQLVGVKGANAIVKGRLSFDAIDLSNLNEDNYFYPFIDNTDDVTTESIYSNGCEWKKEAEVIIGGDVVKMTLTYDDESIKIITGKTQYNPHAEIFGVDFDYCLQVLSTMGTYQIIDIPSLQNHNLFVIDPLLTKTVPTKVGVMYDGGETGEINCEIEGFSDAYVTPDGYNLPLLAGEYDGMKKYKMVIGRNSIASFVQEIYVAVIGRNVIPIKGTGDADTYYIKGAKQIPVVAEYYADPYTYAMTKYVRRQDQAEFNYIEEKLDAEKNVINFLSKYGEETEIDPETQEKVVHELYYEAEGYSFSYITDLKLNWVWDIDPDAKNYDEFSIKGETRYAIATYGDVENGYAIEIAIKVNVKERKLSSIIIDGVDGQYTVDYLKQETYAIPTSTKSGHTVRVKFVDGTTKIVSMERPATVAEDEYCENYVYGELAWAGADISLITEKLTSPAGTFTLFGEGNETSASFGGEICSEVQTAKLSVLVPSRQISQLDSSSVTVNLVTKIENGEMGNPTPVTLTKALFAESDKVPAANAAITPYAINPYNAQACLPENIWLYVPVTMQANGLKEWQKYPVTWLTINPQTGEELDIIKKNTEGRYVLAHPVTLETRLVVYGVVGNCPGKTIIVTMSILNMASDIRSKDLFFMQEKSEYDAEEHEEEDLQIVTIPDSHGNNVRYVLIPYDYSVAATIDPYYTYADKIPTYFIVTLGSGEIVRGLTEWCVVDDNNGGVPLVRSGDFLSATYDKLYDENGFYIFKQNWGLHDIYMVVEQGDVRNEITIPISVDSRELYITADVSGNIISDYLDIFAYGKNNGEIYSGMAIPGYQDEGVSDGGEPISFYSEESSVLLDRIQELIDNDGYGVAGIAFDMIWSKNGDSLYAKTVHWDLTQLKEVAKMLKKASGAKKEVVLTGIMGEGTVNEVGIIFKIAIDKMQEQLSEFVITTGLGLISDGVYAIKNDLDGDGSISLIGDEEEGSSSAEGTMLYTVGYNQDSEFRKYFANMPNSTVDTTYGYTIDGENIFDYLMYFDIDKVFKLSSYDKKSGEYTSPYEYFCSLLSGGNGSHLRFNTNQLIPMVAQINHGGSTATEETDQAAIKFFNESVLGLIPETVVTTKDPTTKKITKSVSYSFLILERLTEGSAIDRVLVVVVADVATVSNSQQTIEMDVLNDDLRESYANGYDLPELVDVTFQTADGTMSYVAKFRVPSWKAATDQTANVIGTGQTKTIKREYINIMEGVSYFLGFTLPEINEAFTLALNIPKKNINKINYTGTAGSEIYDINDGVIVVENAYRFFVYDSESNQYVFSQSSIPTLILAKETDTYELGENNYYHVAWTFVKSSFDEGIFANGTAGYTDGKILIAYYEVTAYCDKNRNEVTQRIELYFKVNPMKFRGIENEEYTVIAGNSGSGNETFNTIVIDPYNAAGNGTFILPTSLTLSFNDGQLYTFSDITYKLTDKNGLAGSNIKGSIKYGPKGHTLDSSRYSEADDPNVLRMRMYLQGYSETGIYIEIQFLERTIVETLIPNTVYREDGSYDYLTDSDGQTVTVNGVPQKNTYYAYADYVYTGELDTTAGSETLQKTGSMSIYYIDPYNSATFLMPQRATFGFKKNQNDAVAGVFAEYDIRGWQFYNEGTKSYEDFVTIADGAKPTASQTFYKVSVGDGINYRCYFNPTANSYAGEFYTLRGYISIGSTPQYFDVVCVVLNRSLRSGVMLNEEYKVSYDFEDPVAAMLKDIPSLIGKDAFVDFDRYCEVFSANGKTAIPTDSFSTDTGEYITYTVPGTYRFVIRPDSYYSRVDEEGEATNYAVIPEILWEDEYDTDGDGYADSTFDSLTVKGYVGDINGNLYTVDIALIDAIEHYSIIVNNGFEQLILSLLWNDLFNADGAVNNSYTEGAATIIKSEKEILEQEVVYAVYKQILEYTGSSEEIGKGEALSDDNKQILSTTLVNIMLQRLTLESAALGITYDTEDEEDMRYIAYRIYNDVKDDYLSWMAAGGNKSAKTEIYEVWTNRIDKFKSIEIKDSRNIGGYQAFKAKHMSNVLNAVPGLSTEEKNKLYSSMEVYRYSYYNNINADIWDEVYAQANAAERAIMEKYQNANQTAIPYLGKSAAYLKFMAAFDEMSDLGTCGEKALASVTIPCITLDSLIVDGASSANTIQFNKFNFDSINKSFSVVFELSYEALYNILIEEAYDNVLNNFRDAQKEGAVTALEIERLKALINDISPKVQVDQNGTMRPILQTDGGKDFGYDLIYDEDGEIKGNMDLQGNLTWQYESSFENFWNTLYDYSYDDAVKVITANTTAAENYNDIMTFEVSRNPSVSEIETIFYAFHIIRVPIIAESLVASLEEKYDFDTDAGKKAALNALIADYSSQYKKYYNESINTASVYVALGLQGSSVTDPDFTVTDEIWKEVTDKYRLELYPALAEQIEASFREGKQIATEVGDRIEVVQSLASYIVERDTLCIKLNDIYDEQKESEDANIGAMIKGGDMKINQLTIAIKGSSGDDAKAALFETAFADYNIKAIYDCLQRAVESNSNAKAEYDIIVNNHTGDNQEGVILYLSLISSSNALNRIANYLFDFVVGYLGKSESPYDILYDNIEGLGYTRENLDTLLSYTQYDATYYDACCEILESTGIEQDAIIEALKKKTLYDAFYAKLKENTDFQAFFNGLPDAFAPHYAAAAKKLYETYSGTASFVVQYNALYSEIGKKSFKALVLNEAAKINSVKEKHIAYRNEYIAKNDYVCSEQILNVMQTTYNEKEAAYIEGEYALNDVKFLSHTFMKTYFGNNGFLAGTNNITTYGYSEDFYGTYIEGYLKERLNLQANAKNYTITETEKVLGRYMKDSILRALVYFCDNLATDEQKVIVAEVATMYIGEKIEGDFETAMMEFAEKDLLTGKTGIDIYNGLMERDDIGTAAQQRIKDSYYTIWLETILGSIKKEIDKYDVSKMIGKVPYTSYYVYLDNIMNGIYAASQEEGVSTAKGSISANIARQMMYDTFVTSLGYASARETAISEMLMTDAEKYAYDRFYEEKSARGVYLYRDALDELLKESVENESLIKKDLYDEAQQERLDAKLNTFENAIETAIETLLYADFYDNLLFVQLGAEGFAKKFYAYLYGEEADDAVDRLFGTWITEDEDGYSVNNDGWLTRIIKAYTSGNKESVSGFITNITNWWLTDDKLPQKTVYGKLSADEQSLMAQIYKQALYQVPDFLSTENFAGQELTAAEREELAAATMIYNVYRFLCDMESMLSEMPRDYFSASNADEYKAFIIKEMLTGDLMHNPEFNLSFAQAKLNTLVYEYVLTQAKYFLKITGKSVSLSGKTTVKELVEQIAYVFMSTSQTGILTSENVGDTTEDRLRIYRRFMLKAISYVDYTSVYGMDDYMREYDLATENPLYEYANSIYIAITGTDINGRSYIDMETETKPGILSFGKLLALAGNDYTNVFEIAEQLRKVTVDGFISEDFATEDSRHVIFFDRVTWDRFVTEGGVLEDAQAYFTNMNVFIANPNKTERFMLTSSNYSYTNAFTANGFMYMLADFTEIDLYFNADEDDPYSGTANTLMIDALSPELPTKVYAKGYMSYTGSLTSLEFELGQVNITEYSDEFYKLVYKETAPTADDAYEITLKTDFGYIFQKKGLSVGYVGRDVDKAYLQTAEYGGDQVLSGAFAGLYSVCDEASPLSSTYGKNVLHIDPIDANMLLSQIKSYVLPTKISVDCGDGERYDFFEIEWDTSKVEYGLNGGEFNLTVKSYKYNDENGDIRKITFGLKNSEKKDVIRMAIYDKDTGEIKGEPRDYLLSQGDLIDWNIVLDIKDRSLKGIDITDENGEDVRIGTCSEGDNKVDATGSSISLNPYYPEYPEYIKLDLAGEKISIQVSNWVGNSGKLSLIKKGEVDTNELYFDATFSYLGYSFSVTFNAMDIVVPRDSTNPIDMGIIYMVRGEGTPQSQFDRNYSYIYYNFGSEEEPNWQKVEVGLDDATRDLSINKMYEQQEAGGWIGANDFNGSAKFTVVVVDVYNHGKLNGTENMYTYNGYYSIPKVGNSVANLTGAPETMNENYSTHGITFTALDENEYNLIENTVTISCMYDMEFASANIAYNANGDRVRKLKFTNKIYAYEKNNVSDNTADIVFNTEPGEDAAWTWTDIPRTSPVYADAIYWPLGMSLNTEDLPTVTDKTTGTEIHLNWDLSDLNVNLANVKDADDISSSDGFTIYGYYMTAKNVWQSKELTIYIKKQDVFAQIKAAMGVSSITTKLETVYSAAYFYLPFDPENEDLVFLRSDGSYRVLDPENYVIEYCDAVPEGERVWSSTEIPLNVGQYYARVRLLNEDENVYISYVDGYTIKMEIKPCVVDLSELMFEGEVDRAIRRPYGQGSGITLIDGLLPTFKPANWFEMGEKATLFNRYYAIYGDETRAKAAVYQEIFDRVAPVTVEIILGWYAEGARAYANDNTFKGLSTSQQTRLIKAWVYDEYFDEDYRLTEVQLLYTYMSEGVALNYIPTDCGEYLIVISLQENPNYTTSGTEKTVRLRIIKDETVSYAFTNTVFTYNGNLQNPEISGLHKSGLVPEGVTVEYTYKIDGEKQIVIVEGVKENNTLINRVTVSTESSVANPVAGIRHVGEYYCSVKITGGKNYIDGDIGDTKLKIIAAKVYIELDTITERYLADVANLDGYVRVYDENGTLQNEGVLLGGDKLVAMGALALRTNVNSYFKVGRYFTYIDGFKTAKEAMYTYAELSTDERDIVLFYTDNDYTFTKLVLKSANYNGSLYADADANAELIRLFGDYEIYVRTHKFDGVNEAAGLYEIKVEENSIGINSDQELIDFMDNLRDGDSAIIYLSPIESEGGELGMYSAIIINAAVNLTIVGYRQNNETLESSEIETRIRKITVLKGTVTLKILSIEPSEDGQVGIAIGQSAGYVTVENCAILALGNAKGVVGIQTATNYKERVLISGTTFKKLSLGIEIIGGDIEMENCLFADNYNGIAIRLSTTDTIIIRLSRFTNNVGTAISTEAAEATIRSNVFEYNGKTIVAPDADEIKGNINYENEYIDNGD